VGIEDAFGFTPDMAKDVTKALDSLTHAIHRRFDAEHDEECAVCNPAGYKTARTRFLHRGSIHDCPSCECVEEEG